ncbi:MAG: sulfatase [Planctomycetaceae bacterium]|nr:sulfatase [Planctomycetaceae bacterium]MCA9043705.1 sulfatase [Planctomycetaceae bacterium]
MSLSCWRLFSICLLSLFASAAWAAEKPNVLIITVDDMSADSMGAFGCGIAGLTPNMDRLAAEGIRFRHAHVQVGNCMPSRNVMWSGRYPHNNGVEGFYQVKDITYPVLCDLMQDAGYLTGIRHKVSHSTPYSPYRWDINFDTGSDGSKPHTKDAASYGTSTREGIQAAQQAEKPFCLVINIADPHKPFYAEGQRGQTIPDPHVPSRVITPDEVPIPGFLFDDPVVRKELAHYYSSVRRADDAVGEILQALDQSGQAKNTLVLFLSDHGMPLPFAKTQLYHHSTHTPLVVRWPGVVEAGAVDEKHMVSAVDFLPTLLDATGIEHPAGLNGRSFFPLLKGGEQEERDFVIKEYNENAGGSRDPMRAVQTKQYLYLFNPWSNGERVMATATSGTSTYRRFAELAKSDPVLAARHDLYQHRVVEELYDVVQDPDCLQNLIDSPNHQDAVRDLRSQLEFWMIETGDDLLPVFRQRDNAEVREAYVVGKEQEAEQRRNGKRGNQNKGANAPKARPKAQLIELVLPETVAGTEEFTFQIRHKFPTELATQKLHVTLKQGNKGVRVSRQVVEASGNGEVQLSFELPEEVTDNILHVAVFVGEDFEHNLQHTQSNPIEVAP